MTDPATIDHHTLLLLSEVDHQLPPSALATTSAEANAAEETGCSEESTRPTIERTTTMEEELRSLSTERSGLVPPPSDTSVEEESRDGIQEAESANPEEECADCTFPDLILVLNFNYRQKV